MKKMFLLSLALAGMFVSAPVRAISLNDIPLWTGSGTNRAALVIEWNSPLLFNATTVPAPVANKTMVWGYEFNGAASGIEMFNAIVAADPRLYAVEAYYPGFGHFVESIGYNLNGNGQFGLSDGTNFYEADTFTSNCLINPNLDVDAAYPLNSGDLLWSGYFGPNWNLWNELGDMGGFTNSPARGTNEYWNPYTYEQGQWVSSFEGIDDLVITNGSWLGFSVAPDGYPDNTNDPNYALELSINTNDVQAPPTPDGTYTAYVPDTNDYAAQVVSTTNLDAASPYNNPAAVLNRPTLQFLDGAVTDRVSIINDPYNVTPAGSDVITEIKTGGQIIVKMGRKVYHNPNNPYGVDLIVYGNSFFTGVSGASGVISDSTDLDTASLTSSSVYGHSIVVSVSPDGTNWYAFGAEPYLFPDDSYRWDDTNACWTDEGTDPTKPINPYLYTNNFQGESVATVQDQFEGAMGGTGYNLQTSGFPWIQYVSLQPGPDTYTVIDAVAAVNPVVVGGALSIAPDNIASSAGSLAFEKPDNSGEVSVTLQFASISEAARVTCVSLSEFSSYAPVPGDVSSAYRILARPMTGSNCVACQANVGLRTADAYAGNGGDLRVYQWSGSNWMSRPFTFNSATSQAIIAGVTNLTAFAVSQIIAPQLSILPNTGGPTFQFTPVPNCPNVLDRSSDLISWTPIATNMPTGNQPVTIEDPNPPAREAFYRVAVTVP